MKNQKEAKVLYTLTHLKPLMAKELDKHKIKYKNNLFDITVKFVTKILKKSINLNLFGKKQKLESLEPVTTITLATAVVGVLGEIIKYFANQKSKESERVLAKIDEGLPTVQDIDEKGNIITNTGKIPTDKVIGKIDTQQQKSLGSFASGMSFAFILVLAFLVLYMFKK